MLRIPDRTLPQSASKTLSSLQSGIDAKQDYSARVKAAKAAWDSKKSTTVKKKAFEIIRETLASMCIGSVRCSYCEDSAADEIEHVRPKNFFPDHTFRWKNYIFACGPCNGPKGNRYGVIVGNQVEEFIRKPKDPVLPPPDGLSALIDPRAEDPLDFIELDLGGVTADGVILDPTFDFVAQVTDSVIEARAEFSIKILGLNRELVRAARENAFGGFRARLREYVQEKAAGATDKRLSEIRDDILRTPHLTVFAEMRRQRSFLPDIDTLFQNAPEALSWKLNPV
jgi:hypothetical protein